MRASGLYPPSAARSPIPQLHLARFAIHQGHELIAQPPVKKYGDQLLIKPEKTSLVRYAAATGCQTIELLAGSQGKNKPMATM